MIQPNDDLFACGVHEPCASATVCDVIGIDDLIIVGIIAAASIAASQISASEQESAGNDMLDRQKANALRQKQFDYNAQESAAATHRLASNPYGGGREDPTSVVQPWIDKLQIQNGYDLGRQQVENQADMTRTNGYIQAGSALAQGIAGQALRPSGGSGSNFGGYMTQAGAGLAERAAGYDLPGTPSIGNPVQTAPLRAADPSGGFQLQEQDYATLAGAAPYSSGPFADDPYGTAIGYQNPNRYRFTL